MSDQQLTVAELMARAAKEGGHANNSSRRRRRRNLEDGGISVAELTGSIPKVEAKPAEARHTAEPIDAPSDSQDSNVPISVVGADDPVRLTTDSFPAQRREAAPAPVIGTTKKLEHSEQDARDTAVIPVVSEDTETQAAAPAPVPVLEPELESDATDIAVFEDDTDEEESGLSVGSVIVMAVLGILVGVGLFLGFKVLWANLSAVVVAILAAVMTLGIVGVVHALRTERDGMSMVLAAIAGVAMTFGPYFVAQL